MRYMNKEMYDGDLLSIVVQDNKLGKFNLLLSENMQENDLGWFLGTGYQGMPIVKINSRVKDKSLMLDTICHELLHLVFDKNGHNDPDNKFSQEYVVEMLGRYAIAVSEVAHIIQRIIVENGVMELFDEESESDE